MPDRPVRLTFPSYDIGSARIMAGDLQVGTVLGEYWNWRAYLWAVADDFAGQLSAEEETRPPWMSIETAAYYRQSEREKAARKFAVVTADAEFAP